MELKISKKASAISPSPTLAIDSKFKEMKKKGFPLSVSAQENPILTPPRISKMRVLRQ